MMQNGASGDAAVLRLRFLRFRIDIESNSARIATRLKAYFRDYIAADGRGPDVVLAVVQGGTKYDARRMTPRVRAGSAGRPPKESYYDDGDVRHILKNRTGVVIRLARGGGRAAITGDVERHTNQVANLISTLFGLSLVERGYVMLHGSAVARTGSDEGLIFLGNSGSGKSSLALQLIERGGYDFVSNDRVLLKERRGAVEMIGLPKRPRVNPGTLLASKSLDGLIASHKRPGYERLTPAELWQLEDKTDVDVARTFGARSRLSATLAWAYSLAWKPSGEGLSIDELEADGAVAAMLETAKDFGVFDLGQRDPAETAKAYRRIARAVRFSRVEGKAAPPALAAVLSQPGA